MRASSSFPRGLLRRHIGDGAQRTCPGWSGASSAQSMVSAMRIGADPAVRDFRQTEIENLGVSALGDKDVGGFDVAMNDALGVRGIESVGDLDRQRQTSASISSGCPAMRCFSVMPSRNSMAMKDWPSCSPIS